MPQRQALGFYFNTSHLYNIPQHQRPKDKTCRPRRCTEIKKDVHSRCVKKSKSKERLTIILAFSASLISRATESDRGGAILVPDSSRLEVSEPAPADSWRQLADDCTDLQDGESENNHNQGEKNEEQEGEDEDNEDVDNEDDEDKFEQHEDNGNVSLDWGVQKLIRYGFSES